jgi:DNA-binding MarR family transcriptional regulator
MSDASAASLPYLVKLLELAVRARVDDIARPAGLTTTQYTALTVLADRPGTTSAELARYSFVTPQTMSQLVGGLIDAGLVDRRVDPASRRQARLYLTARAKRLLDGLRGPMAELERLLLTGLTRQAADQFRSALISARRACADVGQAELPSGQKSPAAIVRKPDDREESWRRGLRWRTG